MNLHSWIRKLLKSPDKQDKTVRSFLAKAVSGTLGLKVLNVALMYINSLLLVKLASASGYGEYMYIMAWLQMLLIPASLGFEGLISRELAVYNTQQKWAQALGLLRFSNQLTLLCSLLLAVIAISGFWLYGNIDKTQSLAAFSIGMASLPLLTLSRLRSASLRAIQNVVTSELPDMLCRPGILFLSLGSVLVFTHSSISPLTVMSLSWIANFTVFLIGTLLLKNKLCLKIQTATPQQHHRLWLRSAMPMLLIGSMYVINGQTDSIMLGLLRDNTSVGIYAVANRGAGLISFVQIAFSLSLAPIFASLFAKGELSKLKKIVKDSCRTTFSLSLLLAAVLFLLSHWFLLIFGPEFLVAQIPLVILIGGQLVNSFTGATAQLLMMTNNDRDTAIGVSISAVFNIFLNALLIPSYGIVGAAIATALSMVIWNIILVLFTYKRFKVLSIAI